MESDTSRKKRSPYQRVSDENMERIEDGIGKFGESFDDVLSRLIDYWVKGHHQEKKR